VWIEIKSDPIDPGDVIARVARASAGGIDVFLGVVRDENDGRPVVLLEYQAYESMAQKEMEEIAREIEQKNPGVVVAAAHRVGALKVGDVAVVCAASAPHRTEAFVRCRALIDAIKHRVPIWKREHGPNGAYWTNWVDARCAHA